MKRLGLKIASLIILICMCLSLNAQVQEPKGNPHPMNKWTSYFNPYLSLGVGLDRAMFFPALGFRSKVVNVQFSAYDDFTAAGMTSVEASVDIKTLSTRTKYRNVLSLGANYFGYYSGDISGTDMNMGGVLVGWNKYRIGGRHQWYAKLGVGYQETSHWSYDWDTNESNSTSSAGPIPNIALGYNLFMFRF